MLVVSRVAVVASTLSLLLWATFSPATSLSQDVPASVPASGAAKPLSTSPLEIESRNYAIGEILARVEKERGITSKQARSWIVSQLGDRLADPGDDAKGSSFGAVGNIELNKAGRGCEVTGSTATVICEVERHRAIAEYLRTLENFGLRQIVIRTRILRGPSEVILNKLPIDWEHVPTNSPFAAAPEESSASTGLAKPTDAGKEELGSSAAVVSAGYIAAPTSAAPTAAAKELPKEDFAEAVSFVERANPVFFSILGEEQTNAFVKAASVEPDIELVMSPSVVVYDGQEGSVGNEVQRPFVVGIEKKISGDSASQTVTFQPKVKVYSEGTKMRLRPELLGNNIRLSCDLDIRKIRKVETFQMPRFDGAGVFQVQIPEVATTRFRANRNLPKDFSMVVATVETDQSGKRSALVVMCQCRTLELEADAK